VWLEGREEDQVSDAFRTRRSAASLARNEGERKKKVDIVRVELQVSKKWKKRCYARLEKD